MSLYLGFDVSTQSCKIVVVDEGLNILFESRVHYDTDFPEYKTVNGVHFHDKGRVTSPAIMWLQAMELALQRLKNSNCPFENIVAISGSGQQHGSVYLKNGPKLNLPFIEDNLLFSDCPIWMDTSTTKECEELEEYLGGNGQVRRITGSDATERFTALHILALRKSEPKLFQQLHQVCLVSSFCASLLCGETVSIDTTDGAGMNLMDISTLTWDDKICSFIGSEFGSIRPLLQPLASPWNIAGKISSFWSDKYGFNPNCDVAQWSGDNPCAIVGMGLASVGDIVISLGTSDTCIFVIPTLPSSPPSVGHIFPHPLLSSAYFGMLVYANGDVTRRKVRDQYAHGSWEEFSLHLQSTSTVDTSEDRYLGSYWSVNEITPKINSGSDIRMKNGHLLDTDFKDERINCRSVIEFRALSMFLHVQLMAPEFMKYGGRLLLTGGASSSPEIRQIFADVFQRPLICLDMPDAAAFGAAIRSYHATMPVEARPKLLEEIQNKNANVVGVPNEKKALQYLSLLKDLLKMEDYLIRERQR